MVDYSKEGDDSINDPDPDAEPVNPLDVENVEPHGDDPDDDADEE